jgi:hypothetical protein
MPTMKVRSAAEVPAAVRGTKAAREAQQEYEGFIRAINSDVGELQLSAGERPRGVKVRLRRAASRLGREIDIWEADGRVYFRLATRRGRPRKAARS